MEHTEDDILELLKSSTEKKNSKDLSYLIKILFSDPAVLENIFRSLQINSFDQDVKMLTELIHMN